MKFTYYELEVMRNAMEDRYRHLKSITKREMPGSALLTGIETVEKIIKTIEAEQAEIRNAARAKLTAALKGGE